jgi:hypothetical protein
VGLDAPLEQAPDLVPAGLAYGQENIGRIPPNSALIFDIELLGTAPPGPPAADPGSWGRSGAPSRQGVRRGRRSYRVACGVYREAGIEWSVPFLDSSEAHEFQP